MLSIFITIACIIVYATVWIIALRGKKGQKSKLGKVMLASVYQPARKNSIIALLYWPTIVTKLLVQSVFYVFIDNGTVHNQMQFVLSGIVIAVVVLLRPFRNIGTWIIAILLEASCIVYTVFQNTHLAAPKNTGPKNPVAVTQMLILAITAMVVLVFILLISLVGILQWMLSRSGTMELDLEKMAKERNKKGGLFDQLKKKNKGLQKAQQSKIHDKGSVDEYNKAQMTDLSRSQDLNVTQDNLMNKSDPYGDSASKEDGMSPDHMIQKKSNQPQELGDGPPNKIGLFD